VVSSTPLEVLVDLVVGLLTGIYASIFGFGGGFIFVPYFYLGLSMPFQKAIGTSLASIILATGSAAATYSFNRRVDFKLGLLLLVAASPMAFLGAWLTRFFNPSFLRIFFSILQAYAGLSLFLEMRFERVRKLRFTFPVLWKRVLRDRRGASFSYEFNPLLAALGGAGAGFLSGMAGIGGGIVNMPLMCLVLGIPIHVAVATSELATLINVSSGSIGHLLAGNIDFARMVTVGLGALLGGQIGSRISMRVKPKILRKTLGLVLILLTVKIVLS